MADCMAMVIRDYNDTELLQYLNVIQSKGSREKVMQICAVGDGFFHYYNCPALMMALRLRKSMDVLLKLIDIGGQELVLMTEKNDGRTALHYACRNRNITIPILTRLIEIGGWELIAMKDFGGETALHYACKSRHLSIEVVSKLIEIGGQKLVVMTDQRGKTPLHYLCGKRNISIDIISKLVEVVGTKLVMMKDNYGRTALHDACRNRNMSTEIISKLIEVGGPKLLMMKDQDGGTALHVAARNGNVSIDVISKLIEVGGQDLLMVDDKNGNIALHHAYFSNGFLCTNYNDTFTLLVQESIVANIGGEFGIGGLFNVAKQEVQNRIYEKWNEFSPALKSALEALTQNYPPILHAAILAKVPLHIIQNITIQLEHSLLKIDSLSRYPFEVALQEGLGWIEGLQEVIKATAVAQLQHPKIISSASQYGLKWRHCMKELAEANGDEIMNSYDKFTGLRLFMVAAMGNYHDLSSIYGMMKMGPEMNVITA